MANDLRKALEDRFESSVMNQEGIMDECLDICKTFSISADDLFYKWEAFSYSAREKDRVISSLTLEGAKDLRKRLLQDKSRDILSPPVSTRKVKTLPRSTIKNAGSSKGFSSPLATPRRAPTFETPTPTTTYRPKTQYVPPQDLATYDYRYMHERISDRSEVLDDIIDDFAELVKDHYDLDDLGDPSTVSEEEIVVVGRICSDGDTHLSDTTILLESSRMMGSGRRVPVSFDMDCTLRSSMPGRSGIGLFPGQIVVLKGKNGSGKRFNASEIWTLPSLAPPPSIEPSDSMFSVNDGSMSAIIASGPYSLDSNLEYTPFTSLLERVKRTRPNVLILLGPFVDTTNSLIKTADVKQSPGEIFHERISTKLDELLARVPDISIFLIPSVKDAAHDHVVFPQNIFNHDALGLNKRINLLSNPATFSLNGITFCASSVDVLFHVKKEEYFKRVSDLATKTTSTGPAPLFGGDAEVVGKSSVNEDGSVAGADGTANKDPMTLLCRNVLEQRSFYPLFPVPKEVTSVVNLDVTHSSLLRLGTIAAPHILILPSSLKHFKRVVDQTLVINPSSLARFNALGTFAQIHVGPSGEGGDNISSRTSVDIIKLE